MPEATRNSKASVHPSTGPWPAPPFARRGLGHGDSAARRDGESRSESGRGSGGSRSSGLGSPCFGVPRSPLSTGRRSPATLSRVCVSSARGHRATCPRPSSANGRGVRPLGAQGAWSPERTLSRRGAKPPLLPRAPWRRQGRAAFAWGKHTFAFSPQGPYRDADDLGFPQKNTFASLTSAVQAPRGAGHGPGEPAPRGIGRLRQTRTEVAQAAGLRDHGARGSGEGRAAAHGGPGGQQTAAGPATGKEGAAPGTRAGSVSRARRVDTRSGSKTQFTRREITFIVTPASGEFNFNVNEVYMRSFPSPAPWIEV